MQWGVATHYVTTDKLDDLRNEITQSIREHHTKEDVAEIVSKYSDSSAESEPIAHLEDINEVFTPDGTIHDLVSRLEARGDTDFGKSALKKLSLMSPLALGVVHE